MPSGESSSLSFPEGQHDGSEAQHDDSEGQYDDSEGAWTNTRRSVGACDVDRAWGGSECGDEGMVSESGGVVDERVKRSEAHLFLGQRSLRYLVVEMQRCRDAGQDQRGVRDELGLRRRGKGSWSCSRECAYTQSELHCDLHHPSSGHPPTICPVSGSIASAASVCVCVCVLVRGRSSIRQLYVCAVRSHPPKSPKRGSYLILKALSRAPRAPALSPGGNSCLVIVPKNGSETFGQGYSPFTFAAKKSEAITSYLRTNVRREEREEG